MPTTSLRSVRYIRNDIHPGSLPICLSHSCPTRVIGSCSSSITMSAPSQASEEQNAASLLGSGSDVAQCFVVTNHSVLHFLNDRSEASQITDAQFTDHINTTFDPGQVLWLSTGRDGSSRPTGRLDRAQAKSKLVVWTFFDRIGSHEEDPTIRQDIQYLATMQAQNGFPQDGGASSRTTARSASSQVMDDAGLEPCRMM